MKSFKKKTILITASLITALISLYFLTTSSNRQPWTMVLFTNQDNGYKHLDDWNKFETKELCEQASQQILSDKNRLRELGCDNDCLVDRFFCGKDCFIPSVIGSVFASEIECSEKHFGERPPRTNPESP